jgi:hypothetical protein
LYGTAEAVPYVQREFFRSLFSPYISNQIIPAFRPWSTLFLSFAGMPDALAGMGRSLRFATPDFLWTLVALADLMRLSLKGKAAHVVASSAARQEIRVRFGRDGNSVGVRITEVGVIASLP